MTDLVKITQIKATGIPDASMFSNPQFYIQFKVGNDSKKTAVAKLANHQVQWDTAFFFDVEGPVYLKAEIFSHSLLGDTSFRKTNEVTIDNLVTYGATDLIRMSVYDPQSDPHTSAGILEFSIVPYIVNPRIKKRQKAEGRKTSIRFSGFMRFFTRDPVSPRDVKRGRGTDRVSQSAPTSPSYLDIPNHSHGGSSRAGSIRSRKESPANPSFLEIPSHSRSASVNSRKEPHIRIATPDGTLGPESVRRSPTPTTPILKVGGEVFDDLQGTEGGDQAPPTPGRRQKLLDGVLLRGLS
ncbi:hypothetical protein BJ138DRAFT_1146463 [Hygrophoropsis aurantiaca]|uniref:Uncharacterized protein n=1 Tax=Hygrophoropsis aurantiaca TaxID=72124 RepID=A0ACB8AJ57_9AGAM|nr:hypothetical protein BJ138DRAFT_1146463 [Hygrophoropsis aurantiaca]